MRIDPAALTIGEALAYRDAELARLEAARLVAGLAKGPLAKKARQAVAAHHTNVMALSDRIDGPVSASDAAMTDDELLAALKAAD